MLFEHDAEKLNFALKRQIQTQKEDNAVNKASSAMAAINNNEKMESRMIYGVSDRDEWL